jgi:hypothetical protein
MSAGYSSGNEDGSMTQATQTSGTSNTDYNKTGQTQIQLDPWALRMNRKETKDRFW